MSVWRKALVYLGLVEDEEFEDYEEIEETPPPYRSEPTVRKFHPREVKPEATPPRSGVRAVSPMARPSVHIVEPKAFSDAEQIGDRFRSGVPVIVNLQFADKELAKRLIDFASGLTYGLNGRIQRAAEKVFLLVPHNVEVSAEEKLRLQEKGLFNQL